MKMHIPVHQFVRVYTESATMTDVMEATGLTYGSIMARAARLRAAGVNLKRFPRGAGKKLSSRVEELNALVEGR
jgi:hypothetical protein